MSCPCQTGGGQSGRPHRRQRRPYRQFAARAPRRIAETRPSVPSPDTQKAADPGHFVRDRRQNSRTAEAVRARSAACQGQPPDLFAQPALLALQQLLEREWLLPRKLPQDVQLRQSVPLVESEKCHLDADNSPSLMSVLINFEQQAVSDVAKGLRHEWVTSEIVCP